MRYAIDLRDGVYILDVSCASVSMTTDKKRALRFWTKRGARKMLDNLLERFSAIHYKDAKIVSFWRLF